MGRRDYFKELAPEIVGLDRLKSAGQAGRLDIPAGVDVAVVSPKAVWRQNSFLFWEPYLKIRPSIDLMRPTHIREGHLLS